jgi:hypothetical protein
LLHDTLFSVRLLWDALIGPSAALGNQSPQ